MSERNVTEDDVAVVIDEYDVGFADRKGNPCYVRQVGERRIKVVVAQDDPNFVITVIDLDSWLGRSTTMPITAQYDDEADALYVRIATGERARTITIDETTYVDVDDHGHTVGIELLYPSLGIDFEGIARRLALEQQLPAIMAAIVASGAPVSLPTFTGGQSLASYTMMTYAPEGKVAADDGRRMDVGVTHADGYERQPLAPSPVS